MLAVRKWQGIVTLSGFVVLAFSGVCASALGGENAASGGNGNIKGGDSTKADDAQGPRPIRDLADEIVVTAMQPKNVIASRGEERTAQETPASVTVVDSREIREVMPRTAAEALRRKPGIWVQKTGHNGGAPIIRGFIGNRVLYMFDDIRRNNAGVFNGPNGLLNTVDALDIDRIEVIRGPGSVLYGSDAIGGVINIQTNEDPIYSDHLTGGVRAKTRYASADREVSGRVETYVSTKRLFAFFGGTRRHIEDLEGGDGVGRQSPTSFQEANFDGQFDFLITENQQIEFFMQNFRSPRGTRFDRPTKKRSSERELYGVRYTGKDMGFLKELKATAYFQDVEQFTDDTFRDSDKNEETLGFDIQATSLPFENLRAVYGMHYNRDDIDRIDPQKITENPEVDWDNWAVFATTEWQVHRRLRLDFGIRWDSFALKSSAPPSNKLPGSITKAIAGGSFAASDLELDTWDDAVTGGAGFVFNVVKPLNFVGHVGRALRAPNKSDMLSFGQFTQGFSVPAGLLDPESSLSWELGLRLERPNFAGSATYFRTDLFNAISQSASTFGGSSFIDVNGNGVQDTSEQVFKKQNSGRLEMRGVELEAKYFLPDMINHNLLGHDHGVLSVFGNFTWMESESAGGSGTLLGNGNGSIPTNSLIGLRWDNARDYAKRVSWAQFETSMVGRFDDATATDLAKDPAFLIDPQDKSKGLIRPDGSIPGYTLFNLRGGYKINEHFDFTIAVENILDKRYRGAYSRIDGAGRSFLFGLNVSF